MAQVCGYCEADKGLSQSPGLINTARFLLIELLKWQVEPDLHDEVRTHAIRDARYVLGRMLGRSPLLRTMLGRMLENLYRDVRQCVCLEKGLQVEHLPTQCPYTVTDLLSPFFFPMTLVIR